MLLLHRHDQSMSLLNGFVITLLSFWYFRRLHILMYLLVCKVSIVNQYTIEILNTGIFGFDIFVALMQFHGIIKSFFFFNFSLTRPPKKNKQQIKSYLHPGKNPVNNNIYLMDDFQPSSLLHLTKLDIRQYRNVF